MDSAAWRARAILFAILFYAGTFFWVVVSLIASLFSHRAVVAAVMGWTRTQQVLADRILGIRTKLVGEIPSGACLIAVKHQAIYETLEVVRLADSPVLVIKRELADIPLFGKVTRLYGIIAVERTAGAKALRVMLSEGKKAIASGRRIVIYPEGTRVPVGTAPPLQSGFAGLYRALGLPVVPIAVDSGLFWGKGLARRSGTVTLKVGEVIPPGLGREEIEARVHTAINALELSAQPRP
ncbi:MAG: lysophospholipid acyltransferase family protein [Sphingomicrobium sp.]